MLSSLAGADHESIKAQLKHPMPANYDLIEVPTGESSFAIALVDNTEKTIAYYIRANHRK